MHLRLHCHRHAYTIISQALGFEQGKGVPPAGAVSKSMTGMWIFITVCGHSQVEEQLIGYYV